MGQDLVGRVAGSLAGAVRHLLDTVSALLPRIAAAATVLVVFWGLGTVVRPVAQFLVRYVENPTQRNLIRHVSYYTVWVVVIFIALDVLEVNAQAVGAGLGLGGVAHGFALKDLVSNLVSGLLILEARFWTDSRRADFVQTASAVRVAIVNALTKEGSALPSADERRVTFAGPESLAAALKLP